MHALQSLFLLIWHVISSITIDARNSICHSYWPASRGCSCCVTAPHPRLCGNKSLDLQRTVLERQLSPVLAQLQFQCQNHHNGIFCSYRNIFCPPGKRQPRIVYISCTCGGRDSKSYEKKLKSCLLVGVLAPLVTSEPPGGQAGGWRSHWQFAELPLIVISQNKKWV